MTECHCYVTHQTHFGQYSTTEDHVTQYCPLHAAAKDLLAALDDAFPSDDPEEQMIGSGVVRQARTAIAKAKEG